MPPSWREDTLAGSQPTTEIFTSSVGPQVRLANDVAPFADLGLDVGGEFLRGARHRVGADAGEALLHLRRMHYLDQLGVQPSNDRPRRAGGREDGVPGRHL